MDYEYRILLAERELAHLKEMQKLLGKHRDTTDQRLDKTHEILHDTIAAIASHTAQAVTTHADLQTLGDHVDTLIKALLRREHPNGHGVA